MSDLLETGRPRPTPRRHLPRVLGVVVVVVAAIVLIAAAAWGIGKAKSHFRSAPDYSGSGVGSAVVQIKDGDTAYSLAPRLVSLDVVKSAEAFRKAAAGDSKAASLQPGFYQLHKQMSAAAALTLLLDPKARLQGHVTIPEGSTVNQTLALIAKNSDVKLADLKQAAANPAALGLPTYAKGLEGFLFPATYDIEPGTTAVQALSMMVERFKQSAEANNLVARSQALGLTPYQVVTVASLIERESRLPVEYPKVARVVYNRIKTHMTLGIDASILYGLGRTSGALHQSELERDTPYNTRLHTGLPPTPIASPGDVTLQAALNPAPGDWLYYVLMDKSGQQLFTADYQEFLRQKAKSQAAGLL